MQHARGLISSVLAVVMVTAVLAMAPAVAAGAAVPHYDHIFVIVEENHGFSDVIGNPAAPNLNALADTFGLATDYFGVTHPSEPNYVALLGGSTFGVSDDNPYYLNTVKAPNLMTQLDRSGVSWKAYLQGLPHPGYQGICYPLKCNGAPDSDPLYVSKHDAIQNFLPARTPADWARQVPMGQLGPDLAGGNPPALSYIIPTECSDQHGDPPYCIDSGNPDGGNLATADPQDQRLIAQGDAQLGTTVAGITGAPFWSQGNNAVVVAYDEGDDNAGCCGAGSSDPNGTGGGHVATVVVTSHGPRHAQDATPYNHYSLLSTIQKSLGVGCLQATCGTGVAPMSPLFQVTGSPAIATSPITPPDIATPTPTPAEPQSYTTSTATAGGWQTVPSPLLGTNNNSLGAVAGSGPDDVWAVGDFLPDAPASNQDATLSLAEHFNGTTWTAVPTPNAGPNFNTLFGVAASGGRAWAVGAALNADYRAQALVEQWDGTTWTVADTPQPGPAGNQLYAASATSPSDVWAVGNQQAAGGRFTTLVEHFDGKAWHQVASPNPGSAGDHLYGVAAIAPDNVWAVGQQLAEAGPDQPLIEHFDGQRWSVVASPRLATGTNALYSVAAGPAGVFAAGEADSDMTGAHALVEHLTPGGWQRVGLPPTGSAWTNVWGIAVTGGTVWAAGTTYNATTGNNDALMLRGDGNHWSVAPVPDPGSGSNILGGIATTGSQVWAAGMGDQGGPHQTLLMHHSG